MLVFMVVVKKGIKVLICPSDEQKVMFHMNFGCCRKTHNLVLDKFNKAYEQDNTINPTIKFLNKLLKECKKEFPYLWDVESTSLQQVIRYLSQGFKNFFKNPGHFHHPTFHKKKDKKWSFKQTIRENFQFIKGNILTLRKYGEVKFRTSKEYYNLLNDPHTKFNSITVSFDGINYFATFNIDYNEEEWELTGESIGCDINSNLNGWLVTSDGDKEYFDINHENQVIKSINQLMAKCRKGSRKWKKLHKRIQKWYNKRTNQLEDYTNKLAHNLVKKYDTIVFEKNYSTIKILIGGEQNMVFPLGRFVDKLKYQFAWHKPQAEGVVFVDAKNTSKKCHHCGTINTDLDVKTRNWKCPKCGKTLDRDVNAAINILNRWKYGDSLEKAKHPSGKQ